MDLRQIFIDQQDFFKTGFSKSITFREMMLKKLLSSIKNNEKELLDGLKIDLGNSAFEGYVSELGMMYSSINKTIKNLHKWTKPKKKKTPFYLLGAKANVYKVPYGSTLIMSAFNYPILLALDPLVGAIAAGNSAMLALPSSTPNVNKVLVDLINSTFERDYVYAFVTNRDLNREILTYKFDKIFYTGSGKVGKIVLRAASENLIPTTLELGGKSPALVTRNAKLSTVTSSIVWAKLLNSGQTCVAPDYILVSKIMADELILEINKSVKKMFPGGLAHNSDYSKIVNEKELERLLAIVDADKDYIINNYTYSLDNCHLSLVLLLANLSEVANLKSMESELFGPILPIIVYEDLDEAINYINENDTPLAFYPFSTDRHEIRELLEEVRFGGATVNDCVLHLSNLDLPFGGLGASGMGNYHGKYSIDTFSHHQAVLNTKSSFKNRLMHPPYTTFKEKLIRVFLK